MMVIRPGRPDMEVALQVLGQGLEEMYEHLRRHITYPVTLQLHVPLEINPSPKVEEDGGFSLVHRQGKTVASDPGLVAECGPETVSESDGYIFDSMVIIRGNIPVTDDIKGNAGMETYLFQHMVEEMQAGGYPRRAERIEVHADTDRCLSGLPEHG